MNTEKAVRIATLNDQFRRSGYKAMLTNGVKMLDGLEGLIAAVKRFNNFTKDNDPYGEHDFGAIEWKGNKVFWKIGYYDEHLRYGEDPLAPGCRRVLTIMLAEEY